MMKAYSESKKTDKSQKEALMFVKQKLDSANGLLMRLNSVKEH